MANAKTLHRRIALVAAAALGVGLLVATPANAALSAGTLQPAAPIVTTGPAPVVPVVVATPLVTTVTTQVILQSATLFGDTGTVTATLTAPAGSALNNTSITLVNILAGPNTLATIFPGTPVNNGPWLRVVGTTVGSGPVTDTFTASITPDVTGVYTITFTPSLSGVPTTSVTFTNLAATTMVFDKASYVPGQLATLTVTATDYLGAKANAPIINAGALTSNFAAQGIPNPSLVTAVNGTATLTAYAPAVGGTWIVSGKDVNGNPISATATVIGTVDPATAANAAAIAALQAAVAALSTTIASLVASITAQISALSALVRKILAKGGTRGSGSPTLPATGRK